MADYPVFDVTDWLVTIVEPAGDDIKYWLRGPAGESEAQSWLFKQATTKTIPRKRSEGGGHRPYQQGEDWAEKVCSELAALVGLPAARVQLAVRDAQRGLISRNTKPSGWSLTSGGVLISGIDERYAPKTDSDPKANRVGHNLDNVETVLSGVGSSPGWPYGTLTAFDQFAGFLLFDAWVANRDRHEINWGVLQDDESGELFLSPSFDHGAALGSGLLPDHQEKLARQGAEGWCVKATAHRFEDRSDVTLLSHAADGLRRAGPEAMAMWVQNVTRITPSQWQNVLERVPGLSEGTLTFVDAVLRVNQERIRDEFGTG